MTGHDEDAQREACRTPWEELIHPDDLRLLRARRGPLRGLGTRPALLIVDMTYAFVDDRYPTGSSATGVPCVQANRRLLEEVRAKGWPVFFSRNRPARNQAEWGLWPTRSLKPLPGLPHPHQVVAELEPFPEESVIEKRRPSPFFGTELVSLLTHHRVDTLIITGMTTSGCVRAAAVDAFSYNLHVIVPEECVADRVKTPHAAALFDIHMKYGDVVSLDYLLREIAGRQ